MTQEKILNYILHTPFNTNRSVLNGMIFTWKKKESSPPKDMEFFGLTNLDQLYKYIEENKTIVNPIIINYLLKNIGIVYKSESNISRPSVQG